MKKFIPTIMAIVLSICGITNASARNFHNLWTIKTGDDIEHYEKYIGEVVRFYQPVNDDEKKFDLRKINFDSEYTIQNILGEYFTPSYSSRRNIKLTVVVLENGKPKAKPIKIVCYNSYYAPGMSLCKAEIGDIPLIIIKDFKEYKSRYVGTSVDYDGKKCVVDDIIWKVGRSGYSTNDNYCPYFQYKESGSETKYTELISDALSGGYHTYLSKVEKPADESIRYGETTTIEDEEVTKFSYEDNIIHITIFGTSKEFKFILQNVSENSIKLVWNEAVFVGTDGSTSKIMHTGIKYSQKDGDQPASVVIRGAKLSDVAVPTENVRYSSILEEWTTDSMYPSKIVDGAKVSLMLPIQVKDVINEYIFEFDLQYKYNRPELHQ